MKIKLIISLALICALFSIFAGCTEDSGTVTEPPVSSTVKFKDVQAFLQIPSQVQFTFRISDSRSHAVVINSGTLTAPFRIFEDGAEIDYSETSYFVHPAASLELDMVVLLDFTNSMAIWKEGDKSGIDLEVDWAHELIDQLAPTHRMAIMEYHDRNVDAGVIAPFSADKMALSAALDAFVAQPLDHGSSRVWDALYSAVDIFDGGASATKERTIFFITDGRETSSDKSPSDVIAYARQWQASIFIIGTGSVNNETALTEISNQTGGEYYPAGSIDSFRQRLQQISRDLGGQYKLSYTTLKRVGTHDVRVQFEYEGLSGQFDTSLDLGSIYGDDRVGVITFDSPAVTSGHLRMVVRAQHIPRNIDRIRFRLDTPKTCSVSLIASADGGLCDGWSIAGPDSLGYFELASAIPLEFGDFGPLFNIDISPVTEITISIPFELDTTIYSEGKTFTCPGSINYTAPD
ncbi:MAG: VWA domain-containing protein [Candidatus Zixiibacteriota bacterium]|nr:MAG: VWA domain-containing protein [candidate division Zixibacteria bacterium]